MIDVAINVYGKPYQTAVTLLSLLRHSGQHINRIFFVSEAKQPRPGEYQIVTELIDDRLVGFTPEYFLGCKGTDSDRLNDEAYRHSIRYQFAWEKSDQPYLFITHNDVFYTGDVLGLLTSEIGDHIGIGEVGQCWNCPAGLAKLCSPDRYLDFRPGREEVVNLHRQFPSQRRFDHIEMVDRVGPWPLLECRLNEWVALIDLEKARPITSPFGPAAPFGFFSIDVGTDWFRTISRQGHTARNFDFTSVAQHAWTDGEFGNTSLFEDDRYDNSERIARDLLASDFDIPEQLLRKAVANDRSAARNIKNSLKRIKRVVKRAVGR